MDSASDVESALREVGSPQKAESSRRFFNTGPGEYGEGGRFYGVTVPEQKKSARRFKTLPLDEVFSLLENPVHECRLTALVILVNRYKKSSEEERSEIVDGYLQRTRFVDNWEQRIAMISCYHFIRLHDFTDALEIADILLHHPHDLIHKAVGVDAARGRKPFAGNGRDLSSTPVPPELFERF